MINYITVIVRGLEYRKLDGCKWLNRVSYFYPCTREEQSRESERVCVYERECVCACV